MKALVKLSRNGNSSTITIKGPILRSLGWLPGRYILVEILEDKTLRVRPPTEADITALQSAPRLPEVMQGELV